MDGWIWMDMDGWIWMVGYGSIDMDASLAMDGLVWLLKDREG